MLIISFVTEIDCILVMKLKVLYYNWTPLDYLGKGGGVAVYVRNMLTYLSKCSNPDIVPVFLSSGVYYDSSNICYLRQENDFCGWNAYTIVNSPVMAPMAHAISNIYSTIKDIQTVHIFEELIRAHTPDVIHFESFEGISMKTLELKSKFPQIKFVHSVHDYGSICPKIHLWSRRGINCWRYPEKKNCVECVLPNIAISQSDWKKRSLSGHNSTKPHLSLWVRGGGMIKRWIIIKLKLPNNLVQTDFEKIKDENVALMNKYLDSEICVSARVGEIMRSVGIRNEIIKIDYIGTKITETIFNKCRNKVNSKDFTILYMGYPSKLKGFDFLINCLEKIEADKTNRIVLKFALSKSRQEVIKRLYALKEKYKDVKIFNGYSHEDFPNIMDDVNLGVVPPQWEDNLPQVAVEMVASGIPVMTINNGGAHELNTHPMFTFTGQDDFLVKTIKIIEHRELLKDYWNFRQPLTTMETHIHNLIKIYQS